MHTLQLVSRRALVALFSATLVTTTAWAQAPPDSPQSPAAELDRLLEEVRDERTTTVAVAKVTALSRLSNFVPREDYAAKLESAAEATRDPRAAFLLHQKVAWALHEMKDERYGADGMKGPLGAQGCLRSWEVVGPFDNPSMEGFRDALGPELGEVGPYPGKLAEVDWRPLPPHDRYCEYDLNQAMQPSTAAVAYLSTTVTVPKARRAVLSLGANGAYKVWLNGALVAARDEDAGMWTDNDAWTIDLAAGDNDLLVKLGSSQDGGLGLVARVLDHRTLAPVSVDAAAKWNRVPTEQGTPRPDARGLLAQLEANAETLRGDDMVWNAWLWKSANWQRTATPWRDVAERALKESEALTPKVHALAAELFEEHWERRAISSAARARAPQDPWIATWAAGELLDSISDSDRLAVRDLLARHAATGFLPASVQLSDLFKAQSLDERALAVLESVAHPQRMRIPAFAGRYASLHRAVGDAHRAPELERQAAAITYLSGGQIWTDVRDHLLAGSDAEALELLEEYLRFVPKSQYARTRMADIHRAQGDVDRALALYDELIAEAPGDVDLYQRKADVLLAADRTDEAVATLRLALRQRPQDTHLRDLIAFLEPQQDDLLETWLVENVREIAADTPAAPFNYDTIVDNTFVRVSKNGLASSVVQRVDRVLNPDGIDAVKAHRAAYQDGDEETEVLRVRVYKPDGSTSEDFEQWDSANSRKASTTYNDTAYVTMQANDVEVGDLVEFVYRTSQIANENFRGDYFGDIAYLQGGRPIAFQRYAVVYPEEWELHFRPPKVKHERVDGLDPRGEKPPEGFRSTAFVMRNVPHVESDPSQPGYTDVYDYLLVSNKATYDEIGKWWWNLVEEQLIVDAPIREKVAELVEGRTTDEEKLAAIHNYVVKNTRYLHVGLGIHGWKPYRTSTCFRNRYGDCKDKAALLKVMLEAAGIPAQLVLVRTRRLGTVDQYPASMHIFNHAITYVPSMDLFLDGTAEFNGTRELTTMDQGAQALIVEDGGAARMLTLPVDEPEQNLNKMVLEVDLTGERPVARGTIEARGANAVYFRRALEDPERRDEALESQLADEFPGAKLVTAEYEDLADLERPTKIEFTFEGGQLLRTSGEREYVFPMGRPKNLLDAYARRATRHQDLDIRVPFANETTIRYRLPPTKDARQVPRDSRVESRFGELEIDYEREEGAVVVDVRYSIDVQRVPVADYPEFRRFMADVTAALNETIELVEAQ